MKNKIYKKVINFLIISVILVVIIIIGIDEYKEKLIEKSNIKQSQYSTQILSIQNIYEKVNVSEENEVDIAEEYPKEQIIEKYEGYQVAAKLEIPEIDLETYVLQEFSNNSLNVSVTKFWGVNPNEIGNCCIAGHNFKRKNMFYNLKNLEIGDKFWISDNKVGKVEYEIYNLYEVYPEDVSCLSQETNGNREVTLITCTNNSKKRIIIKAKEVKV